MLTADDTPMYRPISPHDGSAEHKKAINKWFRETIKRAPASRIERFDLASYKRRELERASEMWWVSHARGMLANANC